MMSLFSLAGLLTTDPTKRLESIVFKNQRAFVFIDIYNSKSQKRSDKLTARRLNGGGGGFVYLTDPTFY